MIDRRLLRLHLHAHLRRTEAEIAAAGENVDAEEIRAEIPLKRIWTVVPDDTDESE